MRLADFQNLDSKRIGSWPLPFRALIVLIGCVLLLFAGYWFDTRHQIQELKSIQAQESTLKQEFETKQSKAVNLEPLKQRVAEMEQSFGEQLRLLPNKTEIEGLLVDISQAGLASGLEFELFKPEAEQPEEFYAVQPIKMTVTGTYHEFGEFISSVAALPRIVTIHDIQIQPRQKQAEEDGTLSMETVARTYRYMDEEEIAARQAAEAAKAKKKKKKA
jgi:type IV pilus assembly protein PilO